MKLMAVIFNVKFLSAIFSAIFIILIGYYLRKKQIVDKGAKTQVLSY